MNNGFWIEWDGSKEQPVDDDVLVDVKDRDGEIWVRLPANYHFWGRGSEFPNEEVVAYRISRGEAGDRKLAVSFH